MSYFDRDAGPITDYISIEEIHEELQAEHAAALDEMKRLRAALEIAIDAQQCECSTDDACRFARERDAARADVERLREGIERLLKMETFIPGSESSRVVFAHHLTALLEGEIEDGLGT